MRRAEEGSRPGRRRGAGVAFVAGERKVARLGFVAGRVRAESSGRGFG